MSTALLTLLQGSLLQQQQKAEDCSGWKEPGSVPSLTASKVSDLALVSSSVPALHPANRSPGQKVAVLMQDLLEVVAEIARTDKMVEQAAANAPKDGEALRWHEVSLRALGWSRDALADRQQAMLKELRIAVQSQEAGAPRTQGPPPPPPHVAPPPQPAKAAEPAREAPATPEYSPVPGPQVEGAEHIGSLRADLEKLREHKSGCCLLIRRIKHLGLKSPEKLRGYFEAFGEIEEVLVAHSFEKPSAKRRHGRVRPAALGFVVMTNVEDAEAILAAGEEHTICDGGENVLVAAQRYEPAHALVEDLDAGQGLA